MEKIGNDTFKYNGKLYKVVKKEIGHRCNDTCPLYNYGRCGNICSVMYNQLKNPGFTYEDVVLVEVTPGEASIKNDEIDYKKLYKEEHDRCEEMCKVEQMRLKQLASWYGALPDGDEKQFKKLEEIFPELAGNNDENDKDEKIRKEIIDYLERFIPHHEYDLVAKSRIWIDWLENLEKQKETKPVGQKATWSEEDEETLNNILNDLSQNVIPDDEDTQWLKSLKERYTWRPTEEQMKVLKDAAFDAGYEQHFKEEDVLESLIEDLKKL